jgi:hypothetical protein
MKPPAQALSAYDIIQGKGISKAYRAVFLMIWSFLQDFTKRYREKHDAMNTEIGILRGHIAGMQKRLAKLQLEDE